MAATPAQLKSRYPEFDTIDNSDVQTYLDDVLLSIRSCVFGDKTDLAQICLACHYLSQSGLAGAGDGAAPAGDIIEEKVGDLTRRYASSSSSSSSDETGLNTTKYGKRFLALRKESVVGPLLIRPTGLTSICS